jgi:hypothetical protein
MLPLQARRIRPRTGIPVLLSQFPEGFEDIDISRREFDYNNEKSLEKALSLFHDYQYDEFRYYPFEPSLIQQEVTLDPRLDPNNWFEKGERQTFQSPWIIALYTLQSLYTYGIAPIHICFAQ